MVIYKPSFYIIYFLKMVDENVNGKWLEQWQSSESGVDNVKDGATNDLVDALSKEKVKQFLSMLSELKWLPHDYYFKDIESMMSSMPNHIDPWSWESFKSVLKDLPENLKYISLFRN